MISLSQGRKSFYFVIKLNCIFMISDRELVVFRHSKEVVLY